MYDFIDTSEGAHILLDNSYADQLNIVGNSAGCSLDLGEPESTVVGTVFSIYNSSSEDVDIYNWDGISLLMTMSPNTYVQYSLYSETNISNAWIKTAFMQ